MVFLERMVFLEKMGQSTKNLAPKQHFQLLQKTMCQILPLMVRTIVIIGLLPMICTLSYRSLDHTITHRKGLSHFPEFIHKLIHNLSHEKVTPLTELTFFIYRQSPIFSLVTKNIF